MSQNALQEAMALIDRSTKVLLTGPSQSDGDTICGLLSLQMLLSRLGKKVLSVLPESLPTNFKFLSGSDQIRQDMGEDGNFVISLSTKDIQVDRVKYNIKNDQVEILVTPQSGRFSADDVDFRQGFGAVDLIITVGAQNLEDLGVTFERDPELFSKAPIINIDTSAGNSFFGKVNLINNSVACSSEIVYQLATQEAFSEHLDVDLATTLLSGLISATGSFLEPHTTASSLDAAAYLHAKGAEQSNIINHLFKQKAPDTLRVWGRALRNLQLDPVHKISWTALSATDFEVAEATPDNIDTIADTLLRHVNGAEINLFFVEQEENTLLQIRSNQPDLNMTEIEALFSESTTIRKHGFDVFFSDQSVGECQSDILRKVLKFQKTRHNIDHNFKLQKVKLAPKSDENNKFPHKHASQEAAQLPKIPDSIPFEAPLQPNESQAEITLPADQLPGWIKKKQ